MYTELSDKELTQVSGGQTSVSPQITDFTSAVDTIAKDLALPYKTIV